MCMMKVSCNGERLHASCFMTKPLARICAANSASRQPYAPKVHRLAPAGVSAHADNRARK